MIRSVFLSASSVLAISLIGCLGSEPAEPPPEVLPPPEVTPPPEVIPTPTAEVTPTPTGEDPLAAGGDAELRALRNEVPANVEAIKTAELAYDAAFDQLIAVSKPVPRAKAALNKDPVPWTTGNSFDTLSWAPTGPVRGTYWVELKGNDDIVVHGMIDADGDGTPAHFTATKNNNAVMVTPDNVF